MRSDKKGSHAHEIIIDEISSWAEEAADLAAKLIWIPRPECNLSTFESGWPAFSMKKWPGRGYGRLRASPLSRGSSKAEGCQSTIWMRRLNRRGKVGWLLCSEGHYEALLARSYCLFLLIGLSRASAGTTFFEYTDNPMSSGGILTAPIHLVWQTVVCPAGTYHGYRSVSGLSGVFEDRSGIICKAAYTRPAPRVVAFVRWMPCRRAPQPPPNAANLRSTITPSREVAISLKDGRRF